MKKLFIILILCHLPLYANDLDRQFWGSGGLQHKMSPNLTLKLEGESRYYDNAVHNKFNYQNLGVYYTIRPWLTLTAMYWQGSIKAANWVDERRPVAAAEFKYTSGNWEFCNRYRYAYRFREAHQNYQLCKFRLQVARKQRLGSIPLKHYLNHEIFYNATLGYANINRVRLGTQFTLFKHFRPDVGLVYQINNRLQGNWDYNIALALKLWIIF